MAFEKVGVQLTAQGHQKFVNALNFATRSVAEFQKALQSLASQKDISKGIFKLTQAQELQLEAAKRTMAVMKGNLQFSRKVTAQREAQAAAETALAQEQAQAEDRQRDALNQLHDAWEEEELAAAKAANTTIEAMFGAEEAADGYLKTLIAIARQASLLPGVLGKVAAALAKVATKMSGATTVAAGVAGAGGIFAKLATGISGAVAAIGTAISALSGGTLIAIGIAAAAFVGFIAAVRLAGKVVSGLVSVFGTVAKGVTTLFTKVLSTAVSVLVSGVRTAIDAISSLVSAAVSALGKVVSKVADIGMQFARAAFSFIEQALTMAGRFNEMELAAIATGRGIGLTDEAILGAIKSVNAMNIRYDVAAASVMRMARVQIDLKYATDLVRIAQAMAVETGRDSSEEMTSLTHALTTNNVQMLRRHGIIIDNDKAERDYAETNDLVVGSLTARQKIEAQIQAVIRESTHLMGVYEAALRSGSKIMRSIEGRLIPEFVAALGGPMQGAYSEVARAAFDFLEALNASITAGGRFYPTMVKIGAVLQVVGEGFADLIDKATAFFEVPKRFQQIAESFFSGLGPERVQAVARSMDTAADEMNKSMSDMAVAAFKWGAEIMVQFANGIIAGIRYIANAMVQVAGALASWLAAFSPPKVAPDIAKWGAAAMAEYLRGFGMVDFGAFEGIQKVLGRILSGPKLAGLLGEIIESMATGTVGEDLFARIAAATGAFGAEIVKLTKLQFKYAEALRAVEAAQLALTRAQEAVKGHSIEVDKLVRVYNKMLRAGATDEILDTKLAEINMSERARNAAIIERDEAQGAVKLAQERLDPIKEALALQEKLVDVLLDLAAAQTDVVEKTKKAAKGGADAIIEEFGRAGALIGDEFKTAMQKAIDKIKGTIADRLKGIFQPVWDAWFGRALTAREQGEQAMRGLPFGADVRTGGVVQEFQKITDAWGPLWDEIKGVWEAISAPGGITAALLAFPGPIGDLAKAIEAVKWGELAEAIINLGIAVGGMLGIDMPEGGAGGAFAGITGALERLFLGEEVTVPMPGEQFVSGIPTGETMIVQLLAPFELLTIAINDKLIPAINDFTEKIEGVTKTIKTIADIAERIRDVSRALGIAAPGNVPATSYLGPLGAGYSVVKALIGDPAAGLSEVARDIGGGIIEGVKKMFLVESGLDVLNTIIGFFKRLLQGGSPAVAMHPIGVSISQGVGEGMLLPDGMNTIFESMQFIADEMLAAVGPGADTPLTKTVIAVGEAFTILIAKGIKDNVGRIIGALDEAMNVARVHLAQLGHEAAQRSGWPGSPQDQKQQGGYSPSGGIHHPGEYVIPAGLTRALMQPVSQTSNIQIGPISNSQAIDQAYLISLIQNTVRREVARAH